MMLDPVTDCNFKPGYQSDHSSIELNISYLTLINKTVDKETINNAVKVYNIKKIPDLT